MSSREIVGFLSIIPGNANARGKVLSTLQGGNLAFRETNRRRAAYFWNNNTSGSDPTIYLYPFKNAFLLNDTDPLAARGIFEQCIGVQYPANTSTTLSTYDYKKFRGTNTVPTINSAAIPRVIGGVAAVDLLSTPSATYQFGGGNCVLSAVDVPKDYTQIGIVYLHPTHTTTLTVTTAVGLPYVTFTDGNLIADSVVLAPGAFNLLRIETGSDAGFYFIQMRDTANNRLYLRNLDGTMFSGIAAASNLAAQVGPGRRAFFNEVSVIPLGVGQVEVSGKFYSRDVRDSFQVRFVFDKSGSVATAGAQQGSYFVRMLPWTHGDGALTGNPDLGAATDFAFSNANSPSVPSNFAFFDGGTAGYAFDAVNQRMFFGYSNASGQSGIGMWKWKTLESYKELSNYLGTAYHASSISPAINLGGPSTIVSVDYGTDGQAYFGINHATASNGGLAIIKPDMTTLQYTISNGFPNSQCYGTVVDKSRNRVFASLASGAGTANITKTGGVDFTAADIGRAIKLDSGADAGTYKISTIGGVNQVAVTTLAGGAVSFTGSSGITGTIGDRIYLFFNNATTGAGKINYMESLAPGTFHTRTVTMTNGASITTHNRIGCKQKAVVDQTTGNLYWLSTDTQQQINKYDVVANTHSFRTVANVQTPSGGSGTLGTITQFTAILVNPAFNELWVGSDQGHIKLVLNDFAGVNYKRYFGNQTTSYVNPSGFQRSDGSSSTGTDSRFVQNYWSGPDGKVFAGLSNTTSVDRVAYGRESDAWFFKFNTSVGFNVSISDFIDSVGRAFTITPGATTSVPRWNLLAYEVDYQWDSANSKWIPKEVVQGPLPNKTTSDTISPGCISKPLHSAYEDVLYGLKVRFTPQGGATPPNNEFLGRAGVTGATRTDGATTSASNIFNGSSFVSGDVGRILRVESGADAGVYKITAFSNSTTITVAKFVGAFSASATASSLSYSVWDLGTVGSTSGPEMASVVLADGFAKDNTQDISGITFDSYFFKTVLHENDSAIKVCVPSALGPPGSIGMLAYLENFIRATPQYDAALAHHRALPGSPVTNGDTFLDCFVDKVLDGTGSRASMMSSPSNTGIWNGVNPDTDVLGCSPIVDLGADADIGFIIIRGRQLSASSPPGILFTANGNGLIANLVNSQNAAGTPVASSSIRTSGSTNFNMTANNTTVSVATGDFLGSISIGPNSDGATTIGGNTFGATAGTFLSTHVGQILKINTGADAGSYRITSATVGGEACTIRNLDQSAKQWNASASGVTYEIRDGVRELDMLCSPSLAVPTHKLCVERLLSTTTAQVRTPPRSTLSNQNYECVRPFWRDVKRISHNTEAVPPDVKNNGTWVSYDGREQYDGVDFKIYMDLTDLASTLRTARYWRLGMTPRFSANTVTSDFRFTSMEFYKTNGERVGVLPDQFVTEALTDSDFLSSHVNRVDFIQATSTAVGGSFNGTATIGGVAGDRVTLSGGNKFLGFQVRPTASDGNPISGGSTFNSASIGFTTADVGRLVRVLSGANSGNFYRIATRPSATQITVTTPSGGAVVFGSTETSIQFALHEGIANGGAAPDYVNIGVVDGDREFTITAINDALTELTILEAGQPSTVTGNFEIRRRGFDTTSATTEPAKTARLVRPETIYPLQTGDLAHDSRGALRFFSEDIGAGATRSDGVIAGGSGAFTGSGFTVDDVGRLILVTTGTNKGAYRISAFSSSTSITVANAYTGVAVSLTADAGPVSYRVLGERRFRIAKYVTTLRA